MLKGSQTPTLWQTVGEQLVELNRWQYNSQVQTRLQSPHVLHNRIMSNTNKSSPQLSKLITSVYNTVNTSPITTLCTQTCNDKINMDRYKMISSVISVEQEN